MATSSPSSDRPSAKQHSAELRSARHHRALAQAVFVTFLWSTSWVLIKFGLEAMPPLVFAGLRYGLASLILWAVLLAQRSKRRALAAQTRADWLGLLALGVVMYALTQGGQFVALPALPALPATVLSLALSCTPIVVVALSLPLLGEPPTRRQAFGVALFLVGAWTYLDVPAFDQGFAALGLIAAGVTIAANAGGSLLGRSINRHRGDDRPSPDALVVTTVSMSVGSTLLLAVGLAFEPVPELSLRSWLIIAWLAVVNTAFAFTLWNRSLRHLTATESSVVNNTMLIQIAILAAVFLGEPVSWTQGVGLAVATVGALLVQLRRLPRFRQRPRIR